MSELTITSEAKAFTCPTTTLEEPKRSNRPIKPQVEFRPRVDIREDSKEASKGDLSRVADKEGARVDLEGGVDLIIPTSTPSNTRAMTSKSSETETKSTQLPDFTTMSSTRRKWLLRPCRECSLNFF